MSVLIEEDAVPIEEVKEEVKNEVVKEVKNEVVKEVKNEVVKEVKNEVIEEEVKNEEVKPKKQAEKQECPICKKMLSIKTLRYNHKNCGVDKPQRTMTSLDMPEVTPEPLETKQVEPNVGTPPNKINTKNKINTRTTPLIDFKKQLSRVDKIKENRRRIIDTMKIN